MVILFNVVSSFIKHMIFNIYITVLLSQRNFEGNSILIHLLPMVVVPREQRLFWWIEVKSGVTLA